jgi:hypothetical protein
LDGDLEVVDAFDHYPVVIRLGSVAVHLTVEQASSLASQLSSILGGIEHDTQTVAS